MNELLKELEAAYKMISSIPISGDSVDVMAAARSKIRRVHAELKKTEDRNRKERGE